jgi:hypothetical protein
LDVDVEIVMYLTYSSNTISITNNQTMLRQLAFTAAFLMLQGCSSMGGGPERASNAGDFNPLTLPTVNVEKYNADKQACFKQVQSQIDTNMSQNYNIVKFRECLIQKGYVLLS